MYIDGLLYVVNVLCMCIKMYVSRYELPDCLAAHNVEDTWVSSWKQKRSEKGRRRVSMRLAGREKTWKVQRENKLIFCTSSYVICNIKIITVN